MVLILILKFSGSIDQLINSSHERIGFQRFRMTRGLFDQGSQIRKPVVNSLILGEIFGESGQSIEEFIHRESAEVFEEMAGVIQSQLNVSIVGQSLAKIRSGFLGLIFHLVHRIQNVSNPLSEDRIGVHLSKKIHHSG